MIPSFVSSFLSPDDQDEEEKVFELFGEEVKKSELTINEKRWIQLTRDVSFENV